jgi:hypothetical protein
MSEPIIWKTLTTQQKNLLIHEKAMRLPVQCNGPIQPSHDEGYYECTLCHRFFSLLELQRQGATHIAWPSPYISSFDAALLVLRKVTEHLDRESEAAVELTYGLFRTSACADIYPAYRAIEMITEWTPERMCIAMLRALGCEVVG